MYPFEVDITNLVKTGENKINIIITPTLRNQLVGYAKYGGKDFKNHKRRPLMPSGLLEPVYIIPKKRIIL
jgi:hypothetical protein